VKLGNKNVSSHSQQNGGRCSVSSQLQSPRHLHLYWPHEGGAIWQVSKTTWKWTVPQLSVIIIYNSTWSVVSNGLGYVFLRSQSDLVNTKEIALPVPKPYLTNKIKIQKGEEIEIFGTMHTLGKTAECILLCLLIKCNNVTLTRGFLFLHEKQLIETMVLKLNK